MKAPAPSPSRQTLLRRLGPIDAAALVVANVIGVGIFTTPGIVASMVPHPLALLAVWVGGGVLAFAGAMAYAELATRYPRAGGEYVYLNRTYGPMMGFLSGWTSFVAGFSGAIAAAAMACASLIGRFVPIAADNHALVAARFGRATLTISPYTVIAIGIIAVISAIHVRGLDTGKLLQNVLTGTKVIALVLFAVVGMAFAAGSAPHLAAGGPVRLGSWATAMIPVMFSYSGWNAAAYVAEEIRDPRRNVPRALALGTLFVIVIYVSLNVMYLLALPIGSFGGVRVGELAAARLMGASAGTALTAITVVIILSSISAMVLAGPRVYYAMARDGVFFRSASRVHPRYHTPYVATAAQAVWSSLLVLTGTFEQLLMYTGFAVVLFAGIAVTSLFVVRYRNGRSAGAFSAWGYPAAPLLFCVASLLIVVNAVRQEPGVSLTGLTIMLSGVPLYWWFERRMLADSASQDSAATLEPTPILDRPI